MPKLINASQAKVIETIFKNPGINLTGIIEKTKLSPNYVSNYVNFLSKKNILREERLEKKRVYLRRFFLNLKSSLGKNIFTLFKEEEKEFFFKKYPKLTPILSQLSELKGIEFIVVYGSYAKFTAETDSDLDLLMVGKGINKERAREVLVNLEMEVSIKIETLKIFIKRINEPLHKQILKDNILIYGSGKFVNLLSRFH